MEKERIIDAHTHIFPMKIAAKAVASIGDFYDLAMHDGQGTAEALLKSGREIGTERYLVCSTATKPAQVKSINDFIWEESALHPEFIPFATMHPDLEDLEQEMERILERGYYGIKLHPDFQEFNIDDDRAMEIYRMAEGRLAILFHTGDPRYDYSAPRRMERVAVLGPVRKATQVELSMSDCFALGVKAPVRESGDLRGAGDIVIEGPKGTLDAKGSVIVARAHVHVPPEVALRLKLQDKERVSVQIISERPVTFDNVVIRVNSEFRFKMHIDFDEANAALVSGFTLGKIIRQERQ